MTTYAFDDHYTFTFTNGCSLYCTMDEAKVMAERLNCKIASKH